MKHKSREATILAALSLFILAGCNEKISAELQGGATVAPPTIPDDEFFFRVRNTSNENLGYHLHQTGQSNKLKKCEINKTVTKFSDDDFQADPAKYDITCYLEAEELALYGSGFKLTVEASPNACEFVGYRPYSFFNRMPGDSSASFRVVTCGTNVTDTDAQLHAAQYGSPAVAGVCDQYIDVTTEGGVPVVPTAYKRPLTVTDEEELCRYNYSHLPNGENCDIGVIEIEEIQLSDNGGTIEETTINRTINCAGKVTNCIKGPITKEAILKDTTSGTVLTEVPKDTAYQVEKTYPSLIESQRVTNVEYANFRKFLANPILDYWNGVSYVPGSFLTMTAEDSRFDPLLLSMYSNNYLMDGINPIVDVTTLRAIAGAEVGYATKPLALEPYLGLSDYSNMDPAENFDYTVNPFYTFQCMDNAFEVTARIRIMVRDWDRIFDPAQNYMEYLSDYDWGTMGRQDRQYFPLEGLTYNNRLDWDDLIPMDRSPGLYLPASTIFQPARPMLQKHPSKDVLQTWNFPGNI